MVLEYGYYCRKVMYQRKLISCCLTKLKDFKEEGKLLAQGEWAGISELSIKRCPFWYYSVNSSP
jgi:hypothetical protein